MMSKGTIKDIGFMLVVGLIVLAVLLLCLLKWRFYWTYTNENY